MMRRWMARRFSAGVVLVQAGARLVKILLQLLDEVGLLGRRTLLSGTAQAGKQRQNGQDGYGSDHGGPFMRKG